MLSIEEKKREGEERKWLSYLKTILFIVIVIVHWF